jgi:hypothetical protein
MPVNIQLSKNSDSHDSAIYTGGFQTRRYTKLKNLLVGLGRIELPTSPLSGVRSSQLSYRPKSPETPGKLVELVGIEPATS